MSKKADFEADFGAEKQGIWRLRWGNTVAQGKHTQMGIREPRAQLGRNQEQ